MAYNTKKYLDEEGLKQVIRLLDEYPDNQILGTVIDEIQSELDKKADVESIPEVPVQDVQVNGTSILSNGTANIPIAAPDTIGAVKIGDTISVSQSGFINFRAVGASEVKGGTSYARALTPERQHASVFYGLTKAAGVDMKDSSNPVGIYTPEAKGAIQKMLGVSDLIATEENNLIASKAYAVGDVFTANGKLYKATAAIATDGAIITDGANANCEETNIGDEFVKFTDYADVDNYGIIKVGNGLYTDNQGTLYPNFIGEANLKKGTVNAGVISSARQHIATFYGLAKAAGADEKDSTLSVGQYTDTAKTAIRSMIGAVGDVQVNGTSVVADGVASLPVVTPNGSVALGLVKPQVGLGTAVASNGGLAVVKAEESSIKTGADEYRPIVPQRQHVAVFYGLAKAAGDTTQSASSNAVGTYTDSAKQAIQQMLGVDTTTINVTGTTPTITAQSNHRYVCGEVTSIDFTPCTYGICELMFTSGSTLAVLTLPSTVKMPEWFEVETEKIYDIIITDGVYGAVMSWEM